jgi:crossover junction endodeoxyribonuclease RuvC
LFSGVIDELIGNGNAPDELFFVRERGFSRFAAETQTIFRTVGVSDLVVWDKTRRSFDQLAPKEVKKLIAGDGKAKKAAVAAALPYYIGERTYRTDDESDAVAVGVAWLIKKGYEVKKRE